MMMSDLIVRGQRQTGVMPREVYMRTDKPRYEAKRPQQRSSAGSDDTTRDWHDSSQCETSSWTEAHSHRREDPPEKPFWMRGRPAEDIDTRPWKPHLRESARREQTDAREPARRFPRRFKDHVLYDSSASEHEEPQSKHLRVEDGGTGEREARQAAREAELSAPNRTPPFRPTTFHLIGSGNIPKVHNRLISVRILVPTGIKRQVNLKELVKAMTLPLGPQ